MSPRLRSDLVTLLVAFTIIFFFTNFSFADECIFQYVQPPVHTPDPFIRDLIKLPRAEIQSRPSIDPPAPIPKPKSRVGNYPPAYSMGSHGQAVDTTIDHLVRDHHENRAFIESLSPEERNRQHGMHHMPKVQTAPSRAQGNCANGQCNQPQFFSRRRRR